MGGAGQHRRSAARLAATLTAVLVLVLAIARPVPAADTDTSIATPVPVAGRPLSVVMDDNYPPFIFRDGTGALQGILIDSWAAWSRRTGVPVDLKAMDWGLALKTMAEGRADVIDTIFRTAARERVMEFTQPYATLDVPIFFDAALSGIAGVETLRGFAVGVKTGDACADWLAERGITDLRRYPSYERLADAAIEREVLVFCMDAPPATYFLSKRRALDRFRTTAPLYTGQFHRAVRRGDRATLDLVADGFAGIPETERQEIEYRWYGRSLRQVGWADMLRQFAPYIAAVLGAGVLLLAWTWTLHRQVAARTRRLSEALGNLTESEERFRAIVDNVSDAIFIHDADTGAIVFVNRRMREMYGIGTRPLDSIDVGTLSEGSPPYSLAEARGWMERALRGETPVFDWHARRLDGETFWVEVGIRHARIGPHDRLLVVVRDISERMAHQERLQQLAHHDALTGLPNRGCCSPTGRSRRCCWRRAAGRRWRWCSATSTSSRPSTIRSATMPGTR